MAPAVAASAPLDRSPAHGDDAMRGAGLSGAARAVLPTRDEVAVSVETLAHTIQLIIAPVVMVTACAILASGVLAHFAAVNDRLRLLTRERFDLLKGPDGSLSITFANSAAFTHERLTELDRQIPELAQRLGLIHAALLALYGAVVVFIASMVVIAAAALGGGAIWAGAALICFLGGTAVLLLAVVLVAWEMRQSNESVQYEAHRVMQLGSSDAARSASGQREQAGD